MAKTSKKTSVLKKPGDAAPSQAKDRLNKILFGHTHIDKKDLTEIAIIIIFTLFLLFMHLKSRDII